MFTLSKIELNFCVEIQSLSLIVTPLRSKPKFLSKLLMTQNQRKFSNVGDRILDVGYIFEMLIAETNLDVCHTLYDSSSMQSLGVTSDW